MLLTDIELQTRLESPDNLANRLKALTKPSRSTRIVSLPPTADELIEDLEGKLKANPNNLKQKATEILVQTLDTLKERVIGTDKPEKLARIAESMSKIIESNTPKGGDGVKIGQVIIYAPQTRSIDDYDVIDVTSREA